MELRYKGYRYTDAPMAKILLIDDDAVMCSLMTDYFSHQGLHLESVNDGGIERGERG